ncbi:MAG TPA: F0F1 ATP synthase subunit A [Dehalococcoidia bacterium]
MKNPRTIAIVLGALVLLAVGFLFFRSPKPIIEIKAETVGHIGFFPVVNTYVTSVTVVIVLVILAYFATRKATLIPHGFQNAVEGVVDAFYTICINTAGEKNAKRFFPVIMTIFTFIWIANWMALLPFFNAIGNVQEVNAHHFHEEAQVFKTSGALSLIMPNQKEVEFEVDEAPITAIEDEITEAKAAGASESEIAELEHAKEEVTLQQRQRAIDIQLPKAAGLDVDTSACDVLEGEAKTECTDEAKLSAAPEAQEKLDADGREIGILIPYFRSMNTDINSPLSIAIWAMIFIEFWGITTLGVFKYGAKFINFSSPIAFFVGILEFIAEIARIISFTFRLFGNMLAGEILLLVMTFLAPFLVALPFYALEVFVGLIQAFVFAMLTLVFGVLAVSLHEEHDEHGGHDDPDRALEGSVPVMHA